MLIGFEKMLSIFGNRVHFYCNSDCILHRKVWGHKDSNHVLFLPGESIHLMIMCHIPSIPLL